MIFPDISLLDPLDVSSLLPVPALHIQKFDPLYSVDGWLKNIELHGLSSVYLDTVSVNRWAVHGISKCTEGIF